MTVPGASALTALPDAATFASTMGQAVWLMTVSKAHRDLAIREIEARVTPAIVLQQFKLYMKDKQPIAFVAWALVSDTVRDRLAGDGTLAAEEWRSGANVVIVDCVSPFADPEDVKRQFWDAVARNQGNPQ